MVIGLLSGSIDQQTSDLQAICKEEFEKALPVVAEQLEKTSQLLVKKPEIGWGTMIPFYGETQEEVFADLTCSEYKKITYTRQSLHIIQSLLKIHANTQQAVDTQRIDRNSTDIHTESPVLNVEDASTVINETSVLNQVMSKENNNQSKNPGPENAGSQQVEKMFLQERKKVIS